MSVKAKNNISLEEKESFAEMIRNYPYVYDKCKKEYKIPNYLRKRIEHNCSKT